MGAESFQQFIDEAACTKLLMRYGQAVDCLDRDGLDMLFWPEGDIDLGFFRGKGSEAADFLVQNGRLSLRRCHITANVVLSIAGDFAEADSCAITHAISRDNGPGLVKHLFYGRYLDRLERRTGEWRILKRRYVLHSYTVEPYAEDQALTAMANHEITGEEK